MTKRFEKINEALDIESTVVEIEKNEIKSESTANIKKTKKGTIIDSNDDINLDYSHSRTNNYDLSSTINDAIYEMFEIAKNTQKARDFEVVGQLIKIAKELDDGYLDRHQKMKRIKEEDEKSETKITNQTTNAVFVGSTAELQKFLKENLKK